MFGYVELCHELDKVKDFANVKSVGKTKYKRDIFVVKMKGQSSRNNVVIQAGIHAREHITSKLVIEQIKYIHETNSELPFNLFFFPMINPDGVEIAVRGANSLDLKDRNYLLKLNNFNTDFSMWKANAGGVDLNTNFDANWGEGDSNIFFPSHENYVGVHAFSEQESALLAKQTIIIDPVLTISYHSKGEEVYYQFFAEKKREKRDKKVAKIFSEGLGYKIVNTEKFSAGGYKDWCIQRLKITGLTIEVGRDNLPHKLQYTEFDKLLAKHKNILSLLKKSMKIIGRND